MKNIKHWIIRRLGGIVSQDFTPVQQATILQMQVDNTRDDWVIRMLMRGCETNYSKYNVKRL